MSLWRRWWFRILCLALLAIAGIAFNVYWQRQQAAEELRQVLAELDQAEPDWRLEQIEAKRRVIPDEENGAQIVNAAIRHLPKDWTNKLGEESEKTPPPVKLTDDISTQLKAELEKVEPAVIEGRKLIDYRHGRYPIRYSPDFIGTLVPHQQNARQIAEVLFLDSHAWVEAGESAKGWRSARALLNASRSIGDEPLLIAVLVRVQAQTRTIRSLERILAHGSIFEGDLASMQQNLAEEAAENLFVMAMRGERAGMHQLMDTLESSDTPITVAMVGLTTKKPEATWLDHVVDFLSAREMAYHSHAYILRYHTKLIELAALHGAEKYARLQHFTVEMQDRVLEQGLQRDLALARIFLPGVIKFTQVERHADTLLHCTIAALATERFRLKHNRWPNSLDELIEAKLLTEAPEDLYDGKPIRLRRAADGIVFYSIGWDGKYQGDALDRLEDFDPNRIRVEFRLWDPAKRRQPPLPPRKPADDQ